MLKLLKSISSRASGSSLSTAPTLSAAPNPIVERLQHYQQKHELIYLSVSRFAKQQYQSIILHVDEQKQRIVVDETFPSGLHLLAGQRLTVTLRDGSRGSMSQQQVFQTKVLEPIAGYPQLGHQLAMPEHLSDHQRREAFRVELAGECLWVNNKQQRCRGYIQDISATGIRLRTRDYNATQIRAGDTLNQCYLSVPGLELECDLGVVRAVPESTNQPEKGEAVPALVGARLLSLSMKQRRTLEIYLMNQQREQRLAASF